MLTTKSPQIQLCISFTYSAMHKINYIAALIIVFIKLCEKSFSHFLATFLWLTSDSGNGKKNYDGPKLSIEEIDKCFPCL